MMRRLWTLDPPQEPPVRAGGAIVPSLAAED